MKFMCLLCGWQKLACFLYVGRKLLVVGWAWRLSWVCVSGLNWLISVWGSNSTRFQCGDKIYLVVVWVVEIGLVFVRGAKITCFHVSMQIDFNFVCGTNWLDFSVRDRTWLDSTAGWNGFGCVGCQKWLHFSVVDRHWFGFCVAVQNDLVQHQDRN